MTESTTCDPYKERQRQEAAWAAEHFGPYLHRVRTDLATIEHPDPATVLHGLVEQLCGPLGPQRQHPGPEQPTWWVDPARLTGPVEEAPPILTRDDGATLFYESRVNWLSGSPGSGKTWLALMIVRQAIEADHRAIFIDFEDRPQAFGTRARMLGGPHLLEAIGDADRFRYVDGHSLETGHRAEASEWVGSGLVIIDAATSAGCPANGDDVREWIAQNILPFTLDEPRSTIIVLDHIPKRKEGRPAGPIGSFYKLAAVNGSALRIYGQPWNAHQSGKIHLVVEKDRLGQLPATTGDHAATITGTWQGDPPTFAYTITPPTDKKAAEADLADVKTTVEDAICDELEATGGRTFNPLRQTIRQQTKVSYALFGSILKALVECELIVKDESGRYPVYRLP